MTEEHQQEPDQVQIKPIWWIISGIFIGLISAGLILIIVGRPRGVPIELQAPPTAEPLSIHVDGAVNEPGLYLLPIRSRVQDAVDKAGGFTEEADTTRMNLASILSDGDKVYVPAKNSQNLQEGSGTPGSYLPGEGSGIEPIDLNNCSEADLDNIPGIGPITARAIVVYRQTHGRINSIDELLEIPGIGSGTLDKIKPYIRID